MQRPTEVVRGARVIAREQPEQRLLQHVGVVVQLEFELENVKEESRGYKEERDTLKVSSNRAEAELKAVAERLVQRAHAQRSEALELPEHLGRALEVGRCVAACLRTDRSDKLYPTVVVESSGASHEARRGAVRRRLPRECPRDALTVDVDGQPLFLES